MITNLLITKSIPATFTWYHRKLQNQSLEYQQKSWAMHSQIKHSLFHKQLLKKMMMYYHRLTTSNYLVWQPIYHKPMQFCKSQKLLNILLRFQEAKKVYRKEKAICQQRIKKYWIGKISKSSSSRKTNGRIKAMLCCFCTE